MAAKGCEGLSEALPQRYNLSTALKTAMTSALADLTHASTGEKIKSRIADLFKRRSRSRSGASSVPLSYILDCIELVSLCYIVEHT
jgi:hypothetical protein